MINYIVFLALKQAQHTSIRRNTSPKMLFLIRDMIFLGDTFLKESRKFAHAVQAAHVSRKNKSVGM
jgi:hypothetical protein